MAADAAPRFGGDGFDEARLSDGLTASPTAPLAGGAVARRPTVA
ncbi:hypothetical protein RQM47_01475 [Rubrivirga sp. S365]|uniref:Uncharacterized protein n=1 Tax=Rubrivirga litoralis TaxID=3075598 RepID=A0ABU3BRV3_9BACT|nr:MULTISPECIES: hypothetical protein [unclassified Rubrivirga]MDT0632004.1 hypothetical protein [Rubrivirga sp. F394]MDT7855303.1 hypothetical protein [Rubrivirga sp. S365]